MAEIVQNCPTDVIIPIVFMPGIMGTRLRQTNDPSQKAWDPDDKIFTGISYLARDDGTAETMMRAAAARRKRLLVGGTTHNPNFLEPDNSFDPELAAAIPFADRAGERGWGTPVWSFYGDTLRFLGSRFQQKVSRTVRESNPEFNWVSSPVWAVGYNWTASNSVSGKMAAAKIREAKSEGDTLAAEKNAQCPGVLVVTHSMGGFVARSAVLEHGAADSVLAVFHNVMPTHGAPAAYKRFHYGFENPDGGGFVAHAEYVVLGRGGGWTTSTLGHCPGPQELLPSGRFVTNDNQSRWMTIEDYDGSAFRQLPQNPDPYTDIYQQRDKVYRCANPDWLFPERDATLGVREDPFDYFVVQNNVAKGFHSTMQARGDYHEITYMSHSGDTAFAAWDRIDWQPEALFEWTGRNISDRNLVWNDSREYKSENILIGNEADKQLEGSFWGADWRIAPPVGAGDATVPVSASIFVGEIPSERREVHDPGYEHSAAIKDRKVLEWLERSASEVLANCALF